MTEKMKNGVIKRGDIFYICYRVGGKKKWEPCKGMTITEARELLLKRKYDIKRGRLTGKTATFEKIANEWLDIQLQGNIRHTTIEAYKNTVRHLIEHFGDTNITSLKVPEIRAYITFKLETLTARSVVQHYRILSAILQEACNTEYIHKNYCDQVKAPSFTNKKIKLLTNDQIEQLMAHADPQTRLIIMAAFRTGLRAGELCALRWSDIDLDRGILSVRQTYSHGRFGEPKTESGRREVEMDFDLTGELKIWKEQSVKNAHNLIFTANNGEPINWQNWTTRHWYKLLDRLELPRTKFHSLRHLYGSSLIANNVPISIVSKIMGHSKISITHDIYTHEMPDARDGFRDTLQGIFGAGGSKSGSKTLKVVGSNNR